MLASVLIANYNNATYLGEALDSVYKQSYKNWELVIVDDGSTDNSRQILEELEGSKQVNIFYNKVNMGCGFTKRTCVEKASGSICGFLDPDDILHSDALKMMVENHQLHPEVGLIHSKHYICDEDLNPIRIPDWLGNFQKGESQLTETRISAFATFKQEAYQKTVGINPKLKRAVDQDLYLKLEEVTETKFVDEFLYFYRKHENGISTFDNIYKAKYWNLIAKLDACERRGINKEDFFSDYLRKHDHNTSQSNSMEYKLGKIILKPYRKLKSLIKNDLSIRLHHK